MLINDRYATQSEPILKFVRPLNIEQKRSFGLCSLSTKKALNMFVFKVRSTPKATIILNEGIR